MTDTTNDNCHNQDQNDQTETPASVRAYYEEKFEHLSDRTKAALRIIELECETVRDLLRFHKETGNRH